MRLTKKIGNYYDSASEQWHSISNKGINLNYVFELEQKLGQLEDIEDFIGVDLLTIIKALTDGIYFRTPKHAGFVDGDKIRLASHLTYVISLKETKTLFTGLKIIFGKTGICLNSYAYGKTWALTKEELL